MLGDIKLGTYGGVDHHPLSAHGHKELELVKQSGFKCWSSRISEQPIFYAVTNLKYARQIAFQWNVKESDVGYVTQFEVRESTMKRYPIHKVGGANHTEWWIPAEDLEILNENIIGIIQVIAEYHSMA